MPPAIARHGSGHAPRILLVDDEPAIRLAFSTLLRREGYVVEVAGGGEAGERVLTRDRVDCLILDFRIPEVRGDVLYEFACGVQPHLRHRTVFVTGDIAVATHDALEATGCRVLLKPFDVEDLLAAVAACLDRGESGRAAGPA